jgi:phosphohistidine phosphatase
VLHSPLVRTTQTAEIISSAFNHASVSVEAALQPGGSVTALDATVAALSEQQRVAHIVLVSHQPLVSYLLAHYLGEVGSVPSLPPGGLATLALDVCATGCGTALFWAFPPEYEAGL